MHGADVPLYERSQLSTTAIFQTLPPNHAIGTSGTSTSTAVVKAKGGGNSVSGGGKGVGGGASSVVGKHNKAIATSKSMSTIPSKSSTKLTTNTNTNNATSNLSTALTTTNNTDNDNTDTIPSTSSNTTMSRTKKEIVSAVISGQQLIQIERLNSYCQSHGVSDNYM